MAEIKFSRKDFLNILWGTAAAVVSAELAFVGFRFLSPKPIEGAFGGTFTLGNPEEYPPGSVTPVEAGRFYLVRLEDGGFLAIYRRCTHLGCAVPYDPASGHFICPCHGSAFTTEGDVLNPPAPRPLDIFPLTLNDEGEITVDTGVAIERDHISPDSILYA